MNPIDVKDCLANAVLLLDTREHMTTALKKRIESIGWNYERVKLNFGDYSLKVPLPNGEWFSLEDKVVIERKMSLGELCLCYCGQRARFVREFQRAAEAGAKTYLVIENSDFGSGSIWEKISKGEYKSEMSPNSLKGSIFAWLARYNCTFIFCTSSESGELIRNILTKEAEEMLDKYEA